MAKSRTESPEIRRRQILDAVRGLLAQRGYHRIKLDDVAKNAKLAKGTLYLHFKDKEEIVREVFEDIMDQTEARLNALDKTAGLSTLKEVAVIKLLFFHENRDFFSEFMAIKQTFTSPNRNAIQTRLEKHTRFIADFLDAAVEKKEIPSGDSMFNAFYFMTLIRMFWIRSEMFGNEPKKSMRTIHAEVDTLMHLFLNGIQPAHKGKGQ